MSFTAINKTTNEPVNAIAAEFDENFMKNEEWYADPNLIDSVPEGIDIYKIDTKYRKGTDEIINNYGIIYRRAPHFYIPDAKAKGINYKPDLKEHTKAVNFIYNLIKSNNIKIIYSQNKKEGKILENNLVIGASLFDLNKLQKEVITANRGYVILDICLPFKQYNSLFGWGLAFEIQLTKQNDGLEETRTYERATRGFSVCWLKEDDFVDIHSDFLQLNKKEIKIQTIDQIQERHYKKNWEEIKSMTINYSKMLDKKAEEVTQMVNKIYKPLMKDCPKCNSGLLTIKKGKWGEFYGCSNYPTCSFTIRIT